jgi:hypothetical protein
MRYGFAALLMLVSAVSAASAQVPLEPAVGGVLPTTRSIKSVKEVVPQSQMNADHVLARLMTFDSDRDGRVAVGELAERMQGLVARGDRSGDGALDESEIRLLATAKQFQVRSFGGYGFGDTTGLSSRTHIENSIDDLRLAPNARQEAKRIALAFVDEFQTAAAANLRTALAPVIPGELLAQLEAALTRQNGVTTLVMQTSANGTRVLSVARAPVTQELLSSDQLGAVRVAADAFRAEQQFDDARRSQLVARLAGLLTEEECENLSAALARRPLVKGPGSALVQTIPAGMNEFQFRVNQTLR